MTNGISFRPTTGSQAFGDPGQLFRDAVNSINRATQGASQAFQTFRQGAIDAREQRTEDALSQIRDISSTEALAATNIDQFGDDSQVDVNRLRDALRGQETAIRNRQTTDFEFQQTQTEQKDFPIIQKRLNSLGTLTDAELADIDPKEFASGVTNAKELTDALAAERTLRRQRQLANAEFNNQQNALARRQLGQQLLADSRLAPPSPELRDDTTITERLKIFNDEFRKIRETGQLDASELIKLENDAKQALELDNENVLKILEDTLRRDSSSGKIDRSEFNAKARRLNISDRHIQQYISNVKQRTGQAKQEALAEEEARATKQFERFQRKESFKQLLKDNSQQAVFDYLDEPGRFTDTDFIDADARTEAGESASAALADGIEPRLVIRALAASVESDGDFNLTAFRESLRNSSLVVRAKQTEDALSKAILKATIKQSSSSLF